jgi:hypothetical protein
MPEQELHFFDSDSLETSVGCDPIHISVDTILGRKRDADAGAGPALDERDPAIYQRLQIRKDMLSGLIMGLRGLVRV